MCFDRSVLPGCFQLSILGGFFVTGIRRYQDVRDRTVEIHIQTARNSIPTSKGHSNGASVEERAASCTDDASRSRHPDQWAALQVLDGMGEDLGIAVGVFITDDSDRFGPGRS